MNEQVKETVEEKKGIIKLFVEKYGIDDTDASLLKRTIMYSMMFGMCLFALPIAMAISIFDVAQCGYNVNGLVGLILILIMLACLSYLITSIKNRLALSV